MIWERLADAVLVLHLGFILFALLGGVAVWRWPWLAWLHLPAVTWAVLIELAGWVCPLTPMENRLRTLGGRGGYQDGFVEHYLTALVYPQGLTRDTQILLGTLVLAVNLAVYLRVLRRRSRQAGDSAPSS